MFVMDMPPEETIIKVPANPLNVQDVETPSDAIQPNFWRGVFFWCGLLVKEFQSNNNEMETHHLTKADVTPKHGSIFCRVKSCWSKNKSKTKFPLLWYEHTNLNVCSILCCVVIPKLDKLHLHTFKKAAWHQLLKCKENSTPHFLLVWGPRPLLQ